jgi:hypothetical protein
MQALVEKLYATPRAIVDKTRAALVYKAPQ